MLDYERLREAKGYIDKLARGINPVTDEVVARNDCINNISIARCFFYLSDVLREMIDEEKRGEPLSKKRREVFTISENQLKHYVISESPIPISQIVGEINQLVDTSNMKQLSYRTVTSYLLKNGYLTELLQENGKTKRIPTEKGNQIGIFQDERIAGNGQIYYVNLYNQNAQQFVIDNLQLILNAND